MSDKTEAPTPRKLEDAREEGQVARSLELNTAAILLVGAMLLRGPGKTLAANLGELTVQSITLLPQAAVSDAWLRQWAISSLLRVGPGLGLLVFGLLVTGVVVTVAQPGFLWTSKKIGFDCKRVNPLSGLQRIFSKQGL